jgi:hypothetical protein
MTILIVLTVLASKCVNSLTNILFGYSFHSGWNRERVEAAGTGKSVHVCDIVWKNFLSLSLMTMKTDFFSSHVYESYN